MLGEIEDKIATFEPKFASLESLQQEMDNRIIKLEMAKDMTVVNKKLVNLEKEIVQVAKENVKITTFQQEISNLELAQQKCVEKHTEVTNQIPNLKPDSYYADLVNKQVAKKMVGQGNEIASINSKVTSLEKVVNQHTTTLDHDLVKKVAKLETEVAKKMVGQSNDVFVTEMNSTTEKIAEFEKDLNKNIEQTENTQAFSHFLALMIDDILSTAVNDFEHLMPTLERCRKMITHPTALKMVSHEGMERYFCDFENYIEFWEADH